ncbi:MAG: glycosyltransferase family 1 protein [Spirochaetaceae bacterium]|nr:MAG: glycosyltransferase family 1 protein [Spirochaetaceae bacterium]
MPTEPAAPGATDPGTSSPATSAPAPGATGPGTSVPATTGLRVAFVITRGDSVGGAQIHVRDLGARLVADGADVLVLVGTTGPFTADLDRHSVRWRLCPALARSVNPLRDLHAIREVHRALLRYRPALVSTHTAKAGLVGRLASAWAGVPSLFTAHGWQFAPGIPPAQRALVYTLELLLSRLPGPPRSPRSPRPRAPSGPPNRVITVSRFDYRLARRSSAVPAARLRLIYNGLPDLPPPPLPSPAPQPTARPPGRVPVLTMIARFQAQKDHATLLRALAAVPGPWKLLLVGEHGPTAEAVQQTAAALGLPCAAGITGTPDPAGAAVCNATARGPAARSVQFLGHRTDIAELLAATDIYCLVSHWEGLPRSIIEAMRAALPVVATNVGGVRELVQHEHSGLLIERADISGLAAQLRRLLANPALRQRLGRNARRRYEAHFTFDAMYHATLAVWHELL